MSPQRVAGQRPSTRREHMVASGLPALDDGLSTRQVLDHVTRLLAGRRLVFKDGDSLVESDDTIAPDPTPALTGDALSPFCAAHPRGTKFYCPACGTARREYMVASGSPAIKQFGYSVGDRTVGVEADGDSRGEQEGSVATVDLVDCVGADSAGVDGLLKGSSNTDEIESREVRVDVADGLAPDSKDCGNDHDDSSSVGPDDATSGVSPIVEAEGGVSGSDSTGHTTTPAVTS